MWTHWYHFYHDITEQLFLQNLDALTDQRSIVPYQVIELDDGYQSAWGDWTSTNDKFPHGLEWLAGQISLKGFTPGLWLAPFQVQAKSEVAREHPDWLVKNKSGKPIHAGFQYNLFLQALDATHPAVLEHLCNLVDRISHEWGFGMIKLDFLNAGALPGIRSNPKLTRLEALRAGLEAIRQGETFLLGSGCPFGPAIGIVDAMRIGPDTAPSWEPYFHWLPWAGPLIKREPSMPSLRNALRHTLNLSALHQRWWWNDPDCLLVRDTDTHLTEPEVQSAVTLVGLSGGMLVSSDDLRKLNPERLRWISRLVPNLGLRGSPLGLLEKDMPERYQVRFEALGQTWQDVGLFNWSDRPANCIIKFGELGLAVGSPVHVFDFWSRRYWRITYPMMVFPDVPAHGCKLLRVCEVSETPQLVGDTLHISQGAEIDSWRVEGDVLVIEIMDLGRRVEGELWLALTRVPRMVTCNGEEVKVKDKGEGIYVVHLQFTGKARVEVLM
jgi:alpha-galactosidase